MKPTTTHRRMTNGARRAVQVGVLLAALSISAFAAAAAETATNAMPRDALVLSNVEKDLSEANLRFTARKVETQWVGAKANPDDIGFADLFQMFVDLARIESVGDAARLAQLKGESKISNIATGIALDLKAKGITAEIIGMAAIEALVRDADGQAFQTGFDDLQVRYTLVLDYLDTPRAGQISLDLADKLTANGRQYYAIEILRDFLNVYIDKQPDKATKVALARRAAQSAALIDDPEVVIILTDTIDRAPRDLRADIAAAILSALPEDFERILAVANDAPSAERDLRDAWRASLALTHGRTPTRSVEDILQSSARRLDTRAFELLVSGTAKRAERNRMVAAAATFNLADGSPISAYQKLRNSDFDIASDTDVVVTTLTDLARAGYAQYTAALAGDLLKELQVGRIKLPTGQVETILSALETTQDAGLIGAFASHIQNGDVIGAAANLRGRLKIAFDGPVDDKVGKLLSAELTKLDPRLPAALVTAAYLTAGKLPEPGKLNVEHTARIGDHDTALLAATARRLWLYGERQALLLVYLKSESPAGLKLAVAAGITGNDVFDIRSKPGAEVERVVKALISKAELTAQTTLIKASLGLALPDAQLDAMERSELAERKLRYQLTTGGKLPVVETDDKRALMAKAVFGDFHDAVGSLKAISDYRQRIGAFRTVAESKALILDRKSWLNTAEHADEKVTAFLDLQKASGYSASGMEVWANAETAELQAKRPFLPNLLLGSGSVTRAIPVDSLASNQSALAGISKRGETRATRLMRFSSEHFDDVINLGVREYLFLREGTSTPRIIFVTRGVMTIGELISQIALTDPDAITEENGVVTLNVPLAVNEGASLIISGKEIKELRLSTDNGAFLVNSGKLYVDGITITSHSDKTGGPSYVRDHKQGFYFRPFILSWSGSETYASDSRFLALGYSGGRTYGVSLSSGSIDTASSKFKVSPPTGYFINNSFDNLYYGFYAFEADDIVFVGNELRDGVIYGLDPHDRSHNLMMAYNTAYGSLKKHGIIISREVDDSFILGNLSFDNHGTGIMLDRLSYGTVVYANVASYNHGDGFSAMESPCALVDSNQFSKNARSGVKVRNSWDIHVEGNTIADNQAAGIEAYIDDLQSAALSEFRDMEKDPYYPIATVSVSRNLLTRNKIGVSTRGATEAMFSGNRFVDQLPRYLGGDIKPLALQAVSESASRPVSLRSTCVPRIPIAKSCSLALSGIIPSQTGQPIYSDRMADANFCVSGSAPQATAFHTAAGE